jgi:single-stranded DNA-binding protein
MLNQVILVGRVNRIDKLAEIVSIDIKRPNDKDSDLIPVILNEGLIDSVLKYLTEGSTIGVPVKWCGLFCLSLLIGKTIKIFTCKKILVK